MRDPCSSNGTTWFARRSVSPPVSTSAQKTSSRSRSRGETRCKCASVAAQPGSDVLVRVGRFGNTLVRQPLPELSWSGLGQCRCHTPGPVEERAQGSGERSDLQAWYRDCDVWAISAAFQASVKAYPKATDVAAQFGLTEFEWRTSSTRGELAFDRSWAQEAGQSRQTSSSGPARWRTTSGASLVVSLPASRRRRSTRPRTSWACTEFKDHTSFHDEFENGKKELERLLKRTTAVRSVGTKLRGRARRGRPQSWH